MNNRLVQITVVDVMLGRGIEIVTITRNIEKFIIATKRPSQRVDVRGTFHDLFTLGAGIGVIVGDHRITITFEWGKPIARDSGLRKQTSLVKSFGNTVAF